jgi:hypothetical protein
MFCQLEVELRDGDKGPELSICGSAGVIVTKDVAREQALAYWASYFEEDDAARMRLIDEREEYMTAEQAAQHVLDVDGELHGVDVIQEDGDDVYVLTSCGQIRTELADFFPEAVPFFRFHLNGMRAECEHQEARGEGYDTHGSVVCLECGYALGTGWQRRELPPEVIQWAKTGESSAPAESEPAPLGRQFMVTLKCKRDNGRDDQPPAHERPDVVLKLTGAASSCEDALAKAWALGQGKLSDRYAYFRDDTALVEEITGEPHRATLDPLGIRGRVV